MNRRTAAALIAAALFVGGCATEIPPKLEVRDVSSGRTYTTYQPWGKITKGVGYEFTDIDTGKHITLTNYELKTLESKKSVSNESAEASAYNQAKTRGGVER